MKSLSILFAACAMVFSLAGCSSNYVMHTNDGRTIISDGKPTVDNDTGMISYKDAMGVKQQINRANVQDMAKVSQ